MKAIEASEFGGRDVLRVVDLDEPQPGAGEVRIDVEAVGVNFSEIMQRRGTYYGGPEPPFVPGTEVAGRIDAVGEGVDREPGERVAALVSPEHGAYREKAIAAAGIVFDVPDTLDLKQAAGMPVQFVTAHNCLFEWGGLEDGERVLIHAAAGGVGTAAVQLADGAGAEIFATASTGSKLDHAVDFGANHPINYTDEDFAAAVLDATDGEGVELVLDGVGGEVFESSLDVLVPFGRLVTYGVASGESSAVDTRDVFFENRQVLGYHLGNALENEPGRVFSAVSSLSEAFADGDLEVAIDETFPLEEAAAAHEYVEGRNTTGKVILTVGDSG